VFLELQLAALVDYWYSSWQWWSHQYARAMAAAIPGGGRTPRGHF